MIPDSIVESTAQIVAREGSQIAASINEKHCLGDIVFLSEPMQERRRGVGPAAAEHVNFEQQLRFCVDSSVEPLFLAIGLDLFLVDRDGCTVGGSLCASDTV
ncbi:hypothetical protein GCM10009030_20180 [Haloarcula pellucida]|uniref:Uncharacterized protein n=1 Tax=Haloarcula pellucida TaxID=1427151 RepID=A0A830GP26_9EURY|nr:hypothetical protein GCM10009030_20180 [Halomicroarcula pellucida]